MTSQVRDVSAQTARQAPGILLATGLTLRAVGCGAAEDDSDGSGSTRDSCSLNDNTTETSTLSDYNCALLERDVSSCKAEREAQGLTGFWLKFSCRVSLTKNGNNVIIATGGQPDYKSKYFTDDNACYEDQTLSGRKDNPNKIAAQDLILTVPIVGSTTGGTTTGEGTVGIALNGVSIFDNTAAGTDDIYEEALTFDKCDGHSEMIQGKYHYHTEPVSITPDDDNFIGVMRDGNPVYGKFCNGGTSAPTDLDSVSGHTTITIDSATPVYQYHVNLHTSTSKGTLNQQAWFITDGAYKGTLIPNGCTGC